MRSGPLVQLFGSNNRKPTITGTSRDINVTDTSVWQFAFFPSEEAYCGATPTECRPFFGVAVSSTARRGVTALGQSVCPSQ